MDELTEKEVIERIKRGEINQFNYLVKKYSQKVRFFVRRKVENVQDAEDIVQNSFIKLYRVMDRFDPARKVYPYLLSIAINEIAQFYRDNPQHQQVREEIGTFQVLEEDGELLQKLPLKTDYRKVLNLLVAGYSYREIASRTGKPINTIKTLIRRARIEVKELYGR